MDDPERAEALKKRAKTEPETLEENEWLIVFAAFPMTEIIKFLDFSTMFMLTKTNRQIDKFFKKRDIWKSYAYTTLGENECHEYEELVVDPGPKGINYKWFLWAYMNKEQEPTYICFYDDNKTIKFSVSTTGFGQFGNTNRTELTVLNRGNTNTREIIDGEVFDIYTHLYTYNKQKNAKKNIRIAMGTNAPATITIVNHNTQIKFVVLYFCMKQPRTYIEAFSKQKYGTELAFLRQEIKDFYI